LLLAGCKFRMFLRELQLPVHTALEQRRKALGRRPWIA
jgi:hypothetical protein